mgnify:FL=1
MIILGLDLSTSITGATLLGQNGDTIICESWDTRNKRQFPTIFHKAQFVRDRLVNLGWPVKKIFIEQSLQSFRSGFSSAQTLSTLARFNGIISWICYNELNVTPEYVAASSARKLCELKVPRGTKAKEVALQYFLDNGHKIEYTSHGNPKPGSYDRADSWVVAKAGYQIWKRNL